MIVLRSCNSVTQASAIAGDSIEFIEVIGQVNALCALAPTELFSQSELMGMGQPQVLAGEDEQKRQGRLSRCLMFAARCRSALGR